MSVRCGVYNCDNTVLSKGVSFFKFPSDEELRTKWIEALGKPLDWKPSTKIKVCSVHFTTECFLPRTKKAQKRRIKRTAIPSIVDPTVFKIARTNEKTEPNVTEAACSLEATMNPTTSNANEASNESYIEENLEIETKLYDRVVGDPSNVFHTYSATNIKTKSHSTQTISSVRTKCTQTIRGVDQETQYSSSSSPEFSQEKSWNEKPISYTAALAFSYSAQSGFSQSSDIQQLDESSSPMVESQQSQPLSLTSESEVGNIDSSFDPSGSQCEKELDSSDSASDEGEFPSKKEPHLEDKYIVFASNLLLLFKICHACHTSPVIKTTEKFSGTSLTIITECLNGCCFKWDSQPRFGGSTSWGNYLLAAAIYFSGLFPTKCINALKQFKMKMFSVRMYFNYQRMFHPVIERVWSSEQEKLLAASLSEAITICGDGRADSPGYSAKYGTYTFMEAKSHKILHIELVQSTEVSSSNAMELEGLKRGLTFLKSFGLNICKVVTDKHPSILAFLRDNHEDIVHELDNWHVSKNVKTKLNGIANQKGCGELKLWIKGIINHIYWLASSSTTKEEKIEKWRSILNHMCNIHQGHSKLFPSCAHGQIPEDEIRVWLEHGTDLYCKISKIVNSPYTLSGIANLSNDYQTYSVEVFHSVLNSFCPKRLHFFADSMKSRVILAVLHFNENGHKEQVVDEHGEEVYFLAFPKGKGGEASAKKLLEDSTFEYVELLMQKTYENAANASASYTLMAPACHVEKLSDKLSLNINKSDVIAQKKKRFLK